MSPTSNTDNARAAAGMGPQGGQQRQPGSDLSVIERRVLKTRAMVDPFSDAVASGLKPETLVRDAITAVRNLPKLAECTEPSFFGALMSAAQLGLRPNIASLGHGWVLPYWNRNADNGRGGKGAYEAQWIIGYQGMVELGYKSGLVAKITADSIYANETYRVRRGTDDALEHEPILDPDERGDVVAHYAIVWLQTGQTLWKVIGDAEVRTLRDRVAARNRAGDIVGPWRDDYTPMAQKTPLRALWRFMPKTSMLSLALATDGVVRRGMDKDAAIVEDVVEHEAAPVVETETVTVTVQRDAEQPAAAEPAPAPAAAAEPVSDPPAAAQQHVMISGEVREELAATSARTAYLERIAAKHGDRATEAVMAAVGEAVPLPYLTTAELRRAAEVDL